MSIKSFGNKETEKLFLRNSVPKFRNIERNARVKLRIIDSADCIDDLKIPPGNKLKKLSGDLKDFYSIRINDQYRIIFIWEQNEAHKVEIIDYH